MFNIAGKTSLRLTQLQKGTDYVIVDFARKAPICVATFQGWFLNGAETQRPATLKNMDQAQTAAFVTVPEAVTAEDGTTTMPEAESFSLVKDPDGFGAMFIQRGDKLVRATAYADVEHVAEIRAAAKKATEERAAAKKAAKEAEKAAEAAAAPAPEGDATETEAAAKPKAKRKGRPAKVAPEVVQVTETTPEAEA